MLTESELRNIIRAKISYDENLGEQVGGSGHLGYANCEIDNINKPERVHTDAGEGWKMDGCIKKGKFLIQQNNYRQEG
ncbi:MAG: hypothetical protein ACFFB5_22695 [Promethearchaeota archaeon]